MLEKKEKRRRRTALEIERKYRWKYEGWPKSYGSEGSLNQHMKNKHSEFYQQFVDSLGLNGMMIENSGEYDSVSGSSYSDRSSSQYYTSSKGLTKKTNENLSVNKKKRTDSQSDANE